MFRKLLALALGGAVGLGAIYAWQLLGHALFPFPTADPKDPLKREALAHMSFAAQAWVVGGYAIGAAIGGFIGNRIADARWPAVLIAVMISGAFFATLTAAPQPFLVQIAGMGLPFLVGLALAATVGRRTLVERDRL